MSNKHFQKVIIFMTVKKLKKFKNRNLTDYML